LAAAIIALIAWTGLGVQYVATARGVDGDIVATLWILLRFFTRDERADLS
jgi:hypothetical protein